MNVIVTGASRGIGYETVRFLAQEGHQVLAIARNHKGLEQLKMTCQQDFGRAIHILSMDLSSDDFHPLGQALEDFGGVDIVINNAGFLLNKPFIETSRADWYQMMDINLISIAELTKYLIPYLKASTIGHIVNISSMGGFQGSSKFPGLSAYSASKGALAILTECLAAELSDQSIKVNCLCLGAVNTAMLEQAFPGYKAPLESHEMAGYIGEFALKAHRYMNGQIIPVTLSNP